MSNLDDTIRHITEYPDYFNVTIDCAYMTIPVKIPNGKHDKK